ncbi:hypothetical protein BOX15_Mlig008986g1 [Macrostomum lignano]|uniref:MFS domain-containing protein n=1 Tax=Macrostomum lignano TaxID=282301 RepID=A0A267E2W5_9PLAT|nr:hypothetical protein BOX15_Mlig008986g1 [Macrostomum lignano]
MREESLEAERQLRSSLGRTTRSAPRCSTIWRIMDRRCSVFIAERTPKSHVNLCVRFGLVTLIAGLILMGIGVSASMVPIYALCLEEACRHGFEDNAATINLISSTSNSATSFGLFMGPVVGGSLYEAIGMPKLIFSIVEYWCSFLFCF